MGKSIEEFYYSNIDPQARSTKQDKAVQKQNGNAFDGKGDIFGIACGLLSAVMYAFMVICNKKAKDIVGLENSTLQLTIAFLTVAVFVGLKQGYAIRIAPSSILPIFILGLLNTGIGCYFYFSSIGKLKV